MLNVSKLVIFKEDAEEKIWQDAMQEEFLAIQKNKTWDLVDLPEGKKAIGLKCMFKTKYNEDESLQKYKACLIAKGYSHRQGIDFEETFSPVAHFEMVITFIALAAQLGCLMY